MLIKIKKYLIKKWLLLNTKVIIWDFDGTLYRNNEVGKILEKTYFLYLKTRVKKNISKKWFREKSNIYGGWSSLISKITKVEERKIMDDVEDMVRKHRYIKRDLQIVGVIINLKKHRHMILSNSRKNDIKLGLEKLGFGKNNNNKFVFEKIVSRDDIRKLKPDQESFDYILKYSKELPNKHLMIGDSYHSDLRPAKINGMKFLHINDFLSI